MQKIEFQRKRKVYILYLIFGSISWFLSVPFSLGTREFPTYIDEKETFVRKNKFAIEWSWITLNDLGGLCWSPSSSQYLCKKESVSRNFGRIKQARKY